MAASSSGRPKEPARPSGRRDASSAAHDRGTLTLAKAFSLVREALQQLDPPVDQETLRVRMVAIHGKEDPLLDANRFQRLLRQANDAEVADVRKVGDDEYEVRLTATDAQARAAVQTAAAQVRDQSPSPGETTEAKTGPAAGPPRRGLRHRRGSRVSGAGDAPDIPMVGVVTLDAPTGERKKSSGTGTKKSAKKARKKSTRKKATTKKASGAKAKKASAKRRKTAKASKST